MQSLATVLATAIFAVKAGYDWRNWDAYGGKDDECMFKASVSNEGSGLCTTRSIKRYDWKQDADLTWKILTEACPDLVYAGCAESSWGSDKSMKDLLTWGSCNQCPRCPCNKGQPKNYYIQNYTQFAPPFEVKKCQECSCNEWGRDTGIYAFDCNVDKTFNDPEELKEVQCPYTTPAPTPAPTGGCDDGTGTNRVPGSTFFYYDNDKCETYCFCNVTNGRECQTGWDNIMADEQLKYPFLETCKGDLEDAWDDTSRWVTRDPATTCVPSQMWNRCPDYVTCGSNTDANDWTALTWSYGVYDDDGTFESAIYDCVDCSCTNANTRADCTAYDSGEKSAEDCTKDTLVCTKGDEWPLDNDDSAGCSVGNGETYCGWSESNAVEGFDSDKVCIEDSVEDAADWGCQQGLVCDALFGKAELEKEANSDGICSSGEVTFSVSVYDCIDYKWVSEAYTLEYNQMCCKGDSCNHQDISPTAFGEDTPCASNSRLATLLKESNECMYGDKGLNNDFSKYSQCEVALPENKYKVCSLLEPYWRQQTFCACRVYQMIEKMYPADEHHDGYRTDLQMMFDQDYDIVALKTTLEMWNEGYECGKTFECDITADDGVDQLNASVLSTVFVFVMCYWL